MTQKTVTRSMLLIASDQALLDAIGDTLSTATEFRIDRTVSTLSGLNGRAVEMAKGHDLILFQAQSGDSAELDAIRRLAAGRTPGLRLIALADDGMSFAQLRALNEAGVDEVLPMAMEGADVSSALGQIRPEHTAPQHLGRLVAVVQARGGVGASTLAVNLADQLARTGKRGDRPKVTLADLDLQYGSIGTMLDLQDHDALLDLAMAGGIPDSKFVQMAMKTLPSGLSVLPAPARLGPLDALSATQTGALIRELRASADYVVADLPHAMMPWLEPVLNSADSILMVTDTSVPAIRQCRRQIDFLTADHPGLPIRIVVMQESRPLFGNAALREASKVLERPLDIWLPHDGRAARTASDRGQPLSQVARRSSLTRSISRLARTLVKENVPTASIQPNA